MPTECRDGGWHRSDTKPMRLLHTKLRQHVLWRCLMQDGTGVGVRRRDITAVTIAATAIAA